MTTIHVQRTVSYTDDTKKGPGTITRPGGGSPTSSSGVAGASHVLTSAGSTATQGRRRRSSSLLYKEPPETPEQLADQAVLPNVNATWVNAKGAWLIHFVAIFALKIVYDALPGAGSLSQEASWTLTNVTYAACSYLMFHHVRGVPFDFNSGAFDNLNMWEQIDDGDQYTPAKKFLLAVPVGLFLLSTHYTHYDLTYFTINFLATLAVVIPKLPFTHRLRVGLFTEPPEE